LSDSGFTRLNSFSGIFVGGVVVVVGAISVLLLLELELPNELM
jgi:hypothetical protein